MGEICQVQQCGVLGVGRSRRCSTVFCASHQHHGRSETRLVGTYGTYTSHGTAPVPDLCRPCGAAATASEQIQPRRTPKLNLAAAHTPPGDAGVLAEAVARRRRRSAVNLTRLPDKSTSASRSNRDRARVLLSEYVTVMNTAGNPGAAPAGHPRSALIGWQFELPTGSYYTRLYVLSVDGRVVPVQGWRKPLLRRPVPPPGVPAAEWDVGLTDDQYNSLERQLVQLLTRHDVPVD